MENINRKVNQIIVEVNYKVELIGLLITLSDESNTFKGRFNFNEDNGKYVKELKEKYGYLINHPTIKKYFDLIKKYNLYYQYPIELALSLNDDFEFKEESNFIYKDNAEIIEFCKELKMLEKEINFKDFYESHKDIYLSWIQNIALLYEEYDVKNAISTYCGVKSESYEFFVTLLPFETSGGYGFVLNNEAHNCLRAKTIVENNSIFYASLPTLHTSIHEFLHSIINPITDKYKIFTDETNYLADYKIPGYMTDSSLINETIIRAMTIRIFYMLTGIEDINILEEEKESFVFIGNIYNLLLNYEKNRNTYKDIDSFYLELANSILDISKKERN